MPNELVRFQKDEFFAVLTDSWITSGENRYLKLNSAGFLYLANYWAHRYESRIFLVEDVSDILSKLDSLKDLPGNLRVTFITGGPYSGHSVPVTYIREDNEEAFLIANSKGMEDDLGLVKQLKSNSKIQVLNVKEKRQADFHSCHLEALLIGRDCTAKNEDGSYRIPNLLSRLKSRFKEKDGFDFVKLVDELLKTSQISKFTEKHRELSGKTIVHKDQNLSSFHKRFPEQVTIKHEKEKSINAYLQKKSIKTADSIEIQFYLVQLRDIFKEQWSKKLEKDFISIAKKAFREQGNIITNPDRKGLHEHAQMFMNTRMFSHSKMLDSLTVEIQNLCITKNKTSFFDKISLNASEKQKSFQSELKKILYNVFKDLEKMAPTYMSFEIMAERRKVIENYIENNLIKKITEGQKNILYLNGKDQDKIPQIENIFKELLTQNNFVLDLKGKSQDHS